MIKISNTFFQCKIISVFPTTQKKTQKSFFLFKSGASLEEKR